MQPASGEQNCTIPEHHQALQRLSNGQSTSYHDTLRIVNHHCTKFPRLDLTPRHKAPGYIRNQLGGFFTSWAQCLPITCHTSVNASSASVPTRLLAWAAFNLAYHKFGCTDPVLVMQFVLHWPKWQVPCQRICNWAVSLLSCYVLRCVWWPLSTGLCKQQQLICWVTQPHIWLVR